MMFNKHVYSGRSDSQDDNFGPGFTENDDLVSPMDKADQLPMDIIKEGINYMVTPDLSKAKTSKQRRACREDFAQSAVYGYPGIYLISLLHYNGVLECYLGQDSVVMSQEGLGHISDIVSNLGQGYISSALDPSPEAIKEAVNQALNWLEIVDDRYYFGTEAEVISAAAISPSYKENNMIARVNYRALIAFRYDVPQRVLDASEDLCFYEAITTNTCCGVDLLTFFDLKYLREQAPPPNPKLVILHNSREMPSYALSQSFITELISASPDEIKDVTQDDILRAYHYNHVKCIKDLAKIRHLPIPKFTLTWPYVWYKDSSEGNPETSS